ncbi:MAG: TIGR01777 family oxidoreductase [Planctomycetes bacterium]|nr:TIGR01777 family oxidoreductase [Planctomycetota bacterium]
MHVFVTGSTGLIGSRLVADLKQHGHQVTRMVRSSPKEGEAIWNYVEKKIDLTQLEAADAVVHLAGENIAGRWTEAKKRRIRESRKAGTEFVAESLARLDRRPRVMVCSSAIGYYGDRGDEELTESSPPGEGFLPEVCVEWEAACGPAAEAGIRVVNLRTGLTLAAEGGPLATMLLPFKLGLGGRVSSGRQWWSWIAIDDLVAAIRFALENETLRGPVNGAAPHPVTNYEFTKTLGRVIRRPTIFPIPRFAAKLALGEMAEGLLLASARVLPNRLKEAGFPFRFPELQPALQHVLN